MSPSTESRKWAAAGGWPGFSFLLGLALLAVASTSVSAGDEEGGKPAWFTQTPQGGLSPGALAVGSNQDGRLELFAISKEKDAGPFPFGSVCNAYQSKANTGPWLLWGNLGRPPGAFLIDPTVAADADGRLDVFSQRTGGGIWHSYQPAPNKGPYSAWTYLGSVPGVGLLGPTVGRNKDGRLEVFAVGAEDQAIYRTAQTDPAKNTWANVWTSLGKPSGKNGVSPWPVAAVPTKAGQLALFVSAEDIFYAFQETPGQAPWSAWQTLERPPAVKGPVITATVAVGSNVDGRTELFVTGDDGSIWHRWQTQPQTGKTAVAWGGWASLGMPPGQPLRELIVGQHPDQRLVLFAIGTKDRALWQMCQTAPGDGWEPWQRVCDFPPGVDLRSLAVGRNQDGSLEVFGLNQGTDTKRVLWHVRVMPTWDFLNRAAWAFRNPETPDLPWGTFNQAFDLGWLDYLDPVTYAEYLLFRGNLAANGNCFGMSLLADEVLGAAHLPVHYSGALDEDVWSNYKSLTNNLALDINTRHWQQLSLEYLQQAFDAYLKSPQEIAQQIDQDLRARQYGVLSVTHHWHGHSLVPVAVTQGKTPDGSPTYSIYVYDCNRPYTGPATGDPSPYRNVITVTHDQTGNHFLFTFSPSEDWTDKDGSLYYARAPHGDGWRSLANGLLDVAIIILGDGATVEQITDAKGHRLYRRLPARSHADIDATTNGLGRNIMRVIPLSAGGPQAPQRGASAVVPERRLVKAMTDRYQAGYDRRAEVYVIFNPRQLGDLRVRITPAGKEGLARMLVAGKGQIFEVTMTGTQHPEMAIPSPGDLSRGLSMRELGAARGRTTVTHAVVDRDSKEHRESKEDRESKELRLQEVRELVLEAEPVQVSLAPAGDLRVQGARGGAPLTVYREAWDAKGASRVLEVKKIPFEKKAP
jgi:hypothetical protein